MTDEGGVRLAKHTLRDMKYDIIMNIILKYYGEIKLLHSLFSQMIDSYNLIVIIKYEFSLGLIAMGLWFIFMWRALRLDQDAGKGHINRQRALHRGLILTIMGLALLASLILKYLGINFLDNFDFHGLPLGYNLTLSPVPTKSLTSYPTYQYDHINFLAYYDCTT
jgi:hypothetical protein